ncbi:hypothetical protein ACE6H2_018032 [Prunus campanulata]
MPGPGPHLMYAMGTGLALTTLSNGRFSPHHTLFYTINAFFGPDIGSFSEWLESILGFGFSSKLADLIHHPFYYVLFPGLPLCFLYSWVSRVLLQRRLLDSFSGVSKLSVSSPCLVADKMYGDGKSFDLVPLTRQQCWFLVSAGSFSHFFLDHLFEENGHSKMYTWILSTGWWKGRAPVNPDAVVVVGLLCIVLIGGFIYINRVKPHKSINKQSYQSVTLISIVAILYCLWCASQIHWVNPRRPAVGEEADLGVLVFLAIYFFLPHLLCILSMRPRDLQAEQLPL